MTVIFNSLVERLERRLGGAQVVRRLGDEFKTTANLATA
jgi:hypothetical protein